MTLLFLLWYDTVTLLHSLGYELYEQGILMEKEQVDMQDYIADLVLLYFPKINYQRITHFFFYYFFTLNINRIHLPHSNFHGVYYKKYFKLSWLAIIL